MTNNGSKHVDPLQGMVATTISANIATSILQTTRQVGLPLNVASYAAAMALIGVLAEQHKVLTKDGCVIPMVDQLVTFATKLLHDNELSSTPKPSNN